MYRLTMKLNRITIPYDKFFKKLCDGLRHLIPFAKLKKREKPWSSVTFSKVAGSNLQLN